MAVEGGKCEEEEGVIGGSGLKENRVLRFELNWAGN